MSIRFLNYPFFHTFFMASQSGNPANGARFRMIPASASNFAAGNTGKHKGSGKFHFQTKTVSLQSINLQTS